MILAYLRLSLILQTDASDYGVGGYLFSVINGKVPVIRFFSKSLIGAQLNWSTGMFPRITETGHREFTGAPPLLEHGIGEIYLSLATLIKFPSQLV